MQEEISINWLFNNIKELNQKSLSKINIKNEIDALRLEINNTDINRLKVIFMVNILSKSCKKKSDTRILIDCVINLLDKHTTTTFLIFKLRLIKCLLDNTRMYIPLYYYILEIFTKALSIKESDISMSYDTLYIKGDEVDGVFILQEVKSLLLNNLNMISDCYGFVEVSYVILNDIKSKGIGIYKEYVEGVANIINKHREYIIDCRSKKIKDIKKMIVC